MIASLLSVVGIVLWGVPFLLYRSGEVDLFWVIVIAVCAIPSGIACFLFAWASMIDWSK